LRNSFTSCIEYSPKWKILAARAASAFPSENIEEELADCFAWIGALANLYGVDLERAFLKKYPGVCPTCGKKPCICTD